MLEDVSKSNTHSRFFKTLERMLNEKYLLFMCVCLYMGGIFLNPAAELLNRKILKNIFIDQECPLSSLLLEVVLKFLPMQLDKTNQLESRRISIQHNQYTLFCQLEKVKTF
jgi:NADH:ubiquinone oxidoreductase subunit B-like Fe-S oxidoreductase